MQEKPGLEFKHGTTNGYSRHKCRCPQCTEANSRMCREQRRRVKERNAPVPDYAHGTSTGYTYWSCRCNECKRAFRSLRDNESFGEALPSPPTQCECCKKTGFELVRDHDHSTGRFRGWLCRMCNSGIGKLGDDLPGLYRALSYLEKCNG